MNKIIIRNQKYIENILFKLLYLQSVFDLTYNKMKK